MQTYFYFLTINPMEKNKDEKEEEITWTIWYQVIHKWKIVKELRKTEMTDKNLNRLLSAEKRNEAIIRDFDIDTDKKQSDIKTTKRHRKLLQGRLIYTQKTQQWIN